MSVHLFGIRHHGIGSARSLLAALEVLQPDCILIEGPPDADALIPLVMNKAMQPPVALLIYDPDQPRRAAWYPFAVYSPEWQAIHYALGAGIAVRFMDLPQKHRLALMAVTEDAPIASELSEDDFELTTEETASALLPFDPVGVLAAAAGEIDGESWWGRVVEESHNPVEIFEAIHEAMVSLRAEHIAGEFVELPHEDLREAWMRTTIRAAEKQFEHIAVVCGAWHTPALIERKITRSTDSALLKRLPSVKTVATFAPWTYGRLALSSGYGAGIVSPGWYHHLWETAPSEVSARWLGHVAMLLREEGLLASTAQVIDGLRLSEMLAAMRGRSVGLDELNEASIAVLCAGRTEPLDLIRAKLIVSNRLGSVPPETLAVPLRRHLTALQTKLRLRISPDVINLDLDLRQPTDLMRSQLFHRLNMLNLPWASSGRASIRSGGTFHEYWTLTWSPELDIRLIEASIWGNTVESAAVAFAQHTADESQQLSIVTLLLKQAILSALPSAVDVIVRRLSNLASVTHDVRQLMEAASPLVDTLRYSDVRKTDANLIAPVLESIVVRVCIGLHGASLNLDDAAAHSFYEHMMKLNSALQLAQDASMLMRWYEALMPLTESNATHALLAGAAVRLLFKAEQLDSIQVTSGMRRAFSVGHDSLYGANWLEGFLTSMEHSLLRDETLFTLVDDWVIGLLSEQFDDILPLLRRTFSTFDAPARRNLFERITQGARQVEAEAIDEARAAKVQPLLRLILGVGS